MYRWWVFVHVLGVFGFLATHGVSMFVTLRLRKERQAARVVQLLELSSSTIPYMWASLGALLLGGIVAAFLGRWWGYGWLWASIGVLLLTTGLMYPLATKHFGRVRLISAAIADGSQAVTEDELVGLLRSTRSWTIAGIGFGGLAIILYLMMFQPCFVCRHIDTNGLVIGARGSAFTVSAFVVPAGDASELLFENDDPGVRHNISIVAADGEVLFTGELIAGRSSITYSLPALEPGKYVFRCDLHAAMTGTLSAVEGT